MEFMKFGVCIPNYGDNTEIEEIVRLAKEAENLGFATIALTDHLLRPVSDDSPYRRVFESVTTLSYLAAVTSKVRLCISAMVLPLRDPILLSKELVTIDVMSKGRLILAAGVGASEEEFKIMSSNFHDRGKRQDEYIELIRSLWRGETSFTSKYSKYSFEGAILDPSPVQKNLEIWIAGNSMPAAMRAARLGATWYPNALPFDELKTMLAVFRGAPNRGDGKVMMNMLIDTTSDKNEFRNFMGDTRQMLSADFQKNKQIVEELDELGISCLMLMPDPGATESVRMESIRAFSRELM
jgi:probable F420-dependent oxidoreductase